MSRACHEWASTWQAGCPQVLFGMQFLLVVRGRLDIRMDDRMKNKVLGLVRLGRLDDALKTGCSSMIRVGAAWQSWFTPRMAS
jgi:hypothetical protein